MSRKRSFEQDTEADLAALDSNMDFNMGGFADLGASGPLTLEGDGRKTVTCMH